MSYVSPPISCENAAEQRDCLSPLPATPYTQLANIYLSGSNQSWQRCGEADTSQHYWGVALSFEQENVPPLVD